MPTPPKTALTTGRTKRGDTVPRVPWIHTVRGIPQPENAVVTFSLHPPEGEPGLAKPPLIRLTSAPTPGENGQADTPGAITVEVLDDGALRATIPPINAPQVGKLPWEVQISVPTISVAGPPGAVWTTTTAQGVIHVEQDGVDNTAP